MGKKDSRKPKGRMSSYAFFVQQCGDEHKKQHPAGKVDFAEFSKKCSERWKKMADKEKKVFHDMAHKDKDRYDAEMANYVPAKGETKGKRKRKDPDAPKRNLSPFFLFCNDERSKIKKVHSDWSVGEIAKALGDAWKNVSEADKARYQKQAEIGKAKYQKELEEYKAKKLKGESTVVKKPPPKKVETSSSEEEEEEESEGEESEDESDEE
ncbi:high mobility group protein B2-like [Glandiceps talaboti]